ncbi:hypothetical protein [Pseudomonas fluvialis]|uniref:hypothetical protein n=1 Tax=Pseudomonas fluvialis TaxID=1793966 RepID=UPI0035AEF472
MNLLRPSALLILLGLLCSSPLWAAKRERVDLDYHVRFLPEADQAEVSLSLSRADNLYYFNFNLGDEGAYSDFAGDGTFEQKDNKLYWQPGKGKSTLSWKVRVSHPRGERYDALMTPQWALLRGDDLVPPAHMDNDPKVQLVARLQFELPKGWKSVETGWPRIGKHKFRIDNPERVFDRPTGWIIAGKLGTRRAQLGNTDITISAPTGQGMRRMDVLTLLTFIWPHAQQVFPRDPAKLLIVGAGDPMWRGGLSASNSYYMHSDRPLVSENGTSSLVHELVHVFSRIRDTDRSDWISEGIAEYYAIELMRRAGGLSEDRYHKVRAQLKRWSKDVKSLRGENSSGPMTARAVLLLQDLDKEISQVSEGRHSLDDLTRALMRLEKASTDDVLAISESLLGAPSEVLDSRLLR